MTRTFEIKIRSLTANGKGEHPEKSFKSVGKDGRAARKAFRRNMREKFGVIDGNHYKIVACLISEGAANVDKYALRKGDYSATKTTKGKTTKKAPAKRRGRPAKAK